MSNRIPTPKGSMYKIPNRAPANYSPSPRSQVPLSLLCQQRTAVTTNESFQHGLRPATTTTTNNNDRHQYKRQHKHKHTHTHTHTPITHSINQSITQSITQSISQSHPIPSNPIQSHPIPSHHFHQSINQSRAQSNHQINQIINQSNNQITQIISQSTNQSISQIRPSQIKSHRNPIQSNQSINQSMYIYIYNDKLAPP